MTLAFVVAAPGARAESTDQDVIDLPTALRLAGAGSIAVRMALERMVEAEADYEASVLRFFPWITAGIGYRRHDGNVQDVAGEIFATEKQSYTGGVRVEAAIAIGDAWYQRLAAKQRQAAAAHSAEAERQEAVWRAARAWFDLAGSQAQVGVASEAARISEEYARQLEQAVEAGLAHKADQLRVQVQHEGYLTARRRAEEMQRVCGARLATMLRLDPAVALIAPAPVLVPMTLGGLDESVPRLIDRARSQRPELEESEAMTAAARRERDALKYGPLFPSLEAQALWGGLGGGRDGAAGGLGYTSEYLFGLRWRIGPGGLFDATRVAKGQARLEQQALQEARVQDEISREVVEAITRTQSQSDQLRTAERALELAERTLNLSRERREFGIAEVLEFIQSEQELTRARSRLFEIIAEYNKAQYDLARATGELR